MTRMMIPALATAMLLGAPALALANSGTMGTASSSQQSSSAAHNGVSEQQARKEIQLDGYTHVQNLQKEKSDWIAQAMEGQKQVSLLVDNHGDVWKR